MVVVVFIITGIHGAFVGFWSRVRLGVILTRSAACRTFILGSRSSDCYRIGKGWMDQRDRSKRWLERWIHGVCGGGPRVQYNYKVGVYVTFFAALIYLSATFTTLLNFKLGPNSYSNVYKSRRQSGQSPFTPLLYLLPFPATVLLQIVWLSHPSVEDSAIIYSESLVPFLCAWGLMFAHQVGRIILAHVTKTEFPLLDATWIWSVVGALDVNLPRILGR